MSALFRKVLILSGKSKKTYFICKCLVQPDLEAESSSPQPPQTLCNHKSGTFKSILRHLVSEHSIYLPEAIICDSCQIVLQNSCQVLAHFKSHIEKGVEVFGYEEENNPCESCHDNKNLVKMIRSGIQCQL